MYISLIKPVVLSKTIKYVRFTLLSESYYLFYIINDNLLQKSTFMYTLNVENWPMMIGTLYQMFVIAIVGMIDT